MYLAKYKHDFVYFLMIVLTIVTPFSLFNMSLLKNGTSFGFKHSFAMYLSSGHGYGLKAKNEA
jgi:threonine/homoserine/homoserine lactone efflux protein